MDRLKAPARLMIVSDLDHTMVDHHDPENMSLLRFNALWEAHYRHDSLLVFSTGRSPTLYKQLRKEKPMLTPDITIMSVGTEITYGNKMVPDDGWDEVLNQKWDRNIVTEETSKFPELTLQSETEQRPHKVSFYVDKTKAQIVTKVLSERFAKRGLDVKIIYSGGMDLDILPQGAGKGQALAYLHQKFKTEGKLPINTLVCGDSGNDAELFSIPDVHGVMVSNAQEELLQWYAENAKSNPKIIHATERCAAGIIQAIGHFNLGPNASPRDTIDFSNHELEIVTPGKAVVNFFLFLEKWRRGEVENCEMYMAGMKADCDSSGVLVHPSGVELSLHDAINRIRSHYGDKQGKPFRIWVDKILSTKIGSDTWLAKFNLWELSGEEQQGCVNTAIMTIKNAEATYMHVHQTWLEGSGAKDQSTWLF
ncbi:sucrose-phosphatase 1 isoform X1 [Ricinus communis]|uniref:Sucrose-phosphatase n=1 Tax=Ricinus communis TaxID=3988 RepID=B9SDM9_RICCO|nr:sucrose-phosphatase 1 isoform X1 [Ricinus communis]EEF38308.1 sucrose phosphate phosphatase, putative [Ricinus communis]|eukprot:XP_015577829.1 sucrose-phosphatase 1 isoform X1 [Ricinus communis]